MDGRGLDSHERWKMEKYRLPETRIANLAIEMQAISWGHVLESEVVLTKYYG